MGRPTALLLAVVVAIAVAPAAGAARGEGFELKDARVMPGQPLFEGKRPIRLQYGFAAERPIDLEIRVVRSRSGNVVQVFLERDAPPGERLERIWDGLTRRGKVAPDGRYEFRVGPAGERSRFAAAFMLHGHVFPVDGEHGTRGAVGEFGAGRNGGRVHEGFDVTGDCGTPLLAARAGKVEKTGFDPVLYGYFVRIGGARTKQDYFYSHLVGRAEVDEGDAVNTGEVVGRIGQTGNAAGTPCHLHFEIRIGGEPIDPEPALRRWDRPS